LGLKIFKPCPQNLGSWYFLGVLFKISDEHPRPFLYGNTLAGGLCMTISRNKEQVLLLLKENIPCEERKCIETVLFKEGVS